MLRFGDPRVPVFDPFLKLPRAADLIRRQAGERPLQFRRKITVQPQNLRRADTIGEEVTKNLAVHRRPRNDAGPERVWIFGRERWVGDEPMVFRLFDQGVEEELRGALHRRVDAGQKLFGARILVALPEVQTEPGPSRRPHPPLRAVNRRCCPPQIGIVMRHPSARPVLDPRGPRAGLGQFHNHPDQRLDALTQIGGLG